jgi:NTP pyrophosphatase (non-canonical NTP hydrolase)
MMTNILKNYEKFVHGVTSENSLDILFLKNRLDSLNKEVDVPALLTAAIGLPGESGEFSEIVKKLVFMNKPFTEETKQHLKKELGDIIWYWSTACRALGVDPNEIIAENVEKLQKRYPGGTFDVFYSENRKDGDV